MFESKIMSDEEYNEIARSLEIPPAPKQKDKVEEFRRANNIEVKCISDRILLYIQWGASILKLEEYDKEDYERMMDLYKKVRGEPKYTSKNPKTVAASILYIGAVLSGSPIKQQDIATLFEMSVVTLRKCYHELRKDYGIKRIQWSRPEKSECGMFRPSPPTTARVYIDTNTGKKMVKTPDGKTMEYPF